MTKSHRTALAMALSLLTTIACTDTNCDSGEDCFQKADSALIKGDYEQAFDFAIQGCDYGYGDACAIVGTQYQMGRGVSADQAQAFNYLEQSCELGSGDGCAVLASAYFAGNGVARDTEKAYKMATNGCAVDNAIACMLLGSMQISGQGTTQDIPTGQTNLDKACSLEQETCNGVEQIRSAYRQSGLIQ